MSELTICLDAVLQALKRDVAPAVTTDKARKSVDAIAQMVARMIVNSGEGGDKATPGTPETHFGGADAHRLRVREAMEAFATTGKAADVAHLIKWEGEISNRLHRATMSMLDAPVATASADPVETVASKTARLEAYLRRRFGSDAVKVTDYQDLFGGRSKITSLVSVENCPGLSGNFVIRRDALMNLTGGRSVVQEFVLIDQLHTHGVKVPKPFLVEPDASALGSPFMIVERVCGKAGHIYSTPNSPKLLRQVAGALAKLHTVPLAALHAAGIAAEPPPRERLLEKIVEAERVWTAEGGPISVAMMTCFGWLRKNIDRAYQGAPSLAHGDAMFHNILADGETFTSLLDWELARASFPAEDLGYIRPAITRIMPWEEFMSAYEAAGGPHVAQDQVDFYAMWTVVQMALLSVTVRKVFFSGQTNDVQLAAVTMHDIYIWCYELTQHLTRVAAYS